MLRTPKNRATVVVLAIVLYLTAPLVEWYYFNNELTRGSFPVNADSILLPISIFLTGWVVGAPVVALFLCYALQQYPGQVSLFSFNRARRYWSLIWSVILVAPIFYDVFFAVQSAYRLQPLDVLQALLTAYLLLCLRASIIHRKLRRVAEPVPRLSPQQSADFGRTLDKI